MRFRLVALTAVLAACGGETEGGPGPSSAEDRPLAADFEEVYRIGGIEAEEWDAFTEIADLGFDARGYLYIRDETGSSTRIVVVDGVGALSVAFGRMGDGPGEFRQVGQMVARPDGGAVIVDNGHRAYLLFGVDGSFERAARFADPDVSQTGPIQRMRHGRGEAALYFVRGAAARFIGGEASANSGDRTLYRASLDAGEEAAAVPFLEGWEPIPERQVTMETEDPTEMFGLLRDLHVYFLPSMVFDILPGGGVAYSDSSAYGIKLQTGSAPLRVVGRPLHPQPVTEQLRERARAQALEDFDAQVEEQFSASGLGDDVPEAIREQMTAMMEAAAVGVRDMFENGGFMADVPLVRDLRTTWEGAIWVERWGSDPLAQVNITLGGTVDPDREREAAVEGSIDVLARGGEYVGTFSLAETPMPRAFGPGGLVAFVETDDLGVPTIIVSRLPEAVR